VLNGDGVILVSADAGGQIIVWDVSNGMVLHIFSDGNKPIQGRYNIKVLQKNLQKYKLTLRFQL
jgi:hypothetical protein